MRYFAKCKVPASSLTILGKHRLRYLGARYKRRFFKDLLFFRISKSAEYKNFEKNLVE